MNIRGFTGSGECVAPQRTIDNDAPQPFRQELVDAVFQIAEQFPDEPQRFHRVLSQSIGLQPSGNPYGGYSMPLDGRLSRAEWPRVYDLICRLVPEFQRLGALDAYRENVNRLLSGNGIVWDLGADGLLHRAMPAVMQAQVMAVIRALQDPRFESTNRHLQDAINANDARPRRDRDVCANAYDAMESVAKVAYGLGTGTLGGALDEAQRREDLDRFTVGILRGLETLRHNRFGHGTTTPFGLKPAEVDFVYFTCLAGILLFSRLHLL